MKASSAPPPPKDEADLTPAWLTDALRAAGCDLVVKSVRRSSLDGGHGFMSAVIRCDLEYEGDAAGPRSVAAKILRPHGQSLKHARQVAIWEREIQFYRTVAPSVNIATPRCYYAAADPEREAYALLFEDLSALEQPRFATLAQAKVALDSLARLHAQFWGGDSAVARALETEEQLQRRLRPLIEEAWPRFQAAFATRLGGEVMDAVRQSIDLYGEGLTGDALPPTLLHYDYRPGNMLFGGPDGVVVLDWQAAIVGQGAYDLGHFITVGMSPEDGPAHKAELVDLYRERLRAYGAEPGPLDEFMRQYHRSRLGRMPQSVLSVAYDRSALPEDLQDLTPPAYDDVMPIWRDFVRTS